MERDSVRTRNSRWDDAPVQDADGRPKLAALTAREREVLDRLVLGMSNKLVAHELGISPRTVETHRARLQSKLKARDLSNLVRLSIAANQMH